LKKPLEKILRTYFRLGKNTKVVLAPESAVSFDRMILVYKDNNVIDSLLLYNSKTETVVSILK
jgi:hypothetical protein